MEEENNVELSPIISLLQHVQRSLDIILENESIDIQTKITEDRNMIFQKIQLLMDRQLRAKKWDDLLDEEEEY